jgi:hypothetical protein
MHTIERLKDSSKEQREEQGAERSREMEQGERQEEAGGRKETLQPRHAMSARLQPITCKVGHISDTAFLKSPPHE